MPAYCDIHTHLTHQKFAHDRQDVIDRAVAAGLGAIVVNGLEPTSNREILAMAKAVAQIKPALGIYPIDAVNHILPDDFPIRVGRFDVEKEIAFIGTEAAAGNVAAIGECGLDGHWVDETTFAEQERVFEALIEIAIKNKLPLIVHTRKREQRAAEILAHHSVEHVNFHCFGGRTKWAIKWAEEKGWWFSIPANARRNEAFAKMLRGLPPERILTETDAPYLAPERGERNEPLNVIDTIAFLAEQRGWSVEMAKAQVWRNYNELITL